MSKHEQHKSPAGTHRGDDALESLFRHADVRPRPPADLEHDIRTSLHEEWRALTTRNKRRTYAAWGLAASIVLVALVTIVPWNKYGAAPTPLAQIVRTEGELAVFTPDPSIEVSSELEGRILYSSSKLKTHAGGAALAWMGGESLRMDANTELVLLAPNRVELLRGRLYVDSGKEGNARSRLAIRTPAGEVRHVGTQYFVAVLDDSVGVLVREGRVEAAGHVAGRGERLVVTQNGETHRDTVPTWGPEWRWAEQVTPELDLDGMSALAFIEWAARQTGRSVSFADSQAEIVARETLLNGVVRSDPERALELILQTSDLEHVIIDGNIQVRTRPQS